MYNDEIVICETSMQVSAKLFYVYYEKQDQCPNQILNTYFQQSLESCMHAIYVQYFCHITPLVTCFHIHGFTGRNTAPLKYSSMFGLLTQTTSYHDCFSVHYVHSSHKNNIFIYGLLNDLLSTSAALPHTVHAVKGQVQV